MEVNIQNQLNKNLFNSPMSYYKNIKCTPFGGWSLTLGNSQQQIIIEIPQGIYNLSRSILTFQIAQWSAAANVGDRLHLITPSYYLPWFTGMQLYTASTNNYLIDISSG